MRIVIGTPTYEAVAFMVPVAQFSTGGELARDPVLRDLGPDILADEFDAEEAARRIASLRDVEIADALLEQRALAGIGNIYKSEALFVARIDPFARVGDIPHGDIEKLVVTARRLMRANIVESHRGRPWVYGRAGRPCRRCGSPIFRRKQGQDLRSTYWCERCQRPVSRSAAPSENV
jgi:endonuclease-8